MSEFRDLERVVVGMIVSFRRWLMMVLRLMIFVGVGGLAALIRRAHIHKTGMFARSGSIWGHSAGPAFTIAGGGPVSVLQGLVFEVWIRVGGKAPDLGDFFGHEDAGDAFCLRPGWRWRIVRVVRCLDPVTKVVVAACL
jgi:hypothetical protein